MMARAPWLLAAVLAAGVGVAEAPAQQFDTFGDGPLDGFRLGVDGPPPEGEVPSLGEGGSLTEDGPGITLQITEGQSDVSIRSFPGTSRPVTSVFQPETAQAARVTLRALDKMLGQPTDVDMAVGETVMFGRIAIHAVECRYPSEDPNSDAFAHLEIFDQAGTHLFDGWMVASSPALNALEHPRYDVWVLGCADG